MQTIRKFFNNLPEFLLYAFSLLMLIHVSTAVIILIALLTFAVIKYHKNILPAIWNAPVALTFIGFYLWHLIAMAWSSNIEYGLKDLEIKLSFLIFPIIFSALTITKDVRRKTLVCFAVGCFITCAYILLTSIFNFEKSGEISNFFYNDLGNFIHPAYLSMYLNVAILILLSFLKRESKTLTVVAILSIIIFFLIILMMLSARMAIITSILVCSFFLLINVNGFVFKRRLLNTILFLVIASSLFFISNSFYNRMTQVENAVSSIDLNNSKSNISIEYNSANSRPELWKEALTLAVRNPVAGVGTGDIKDELIKEYRKNNFHYALERKLNPHNQYLHTTIALGLIGLVLLLFCIGLHLNMAIRNSDWLYLCFILVIAINGLTESILEVERGIIFFNFLSMLFYSSVIRRNKI